METIGYDKLLNVTDSRYRLSVIVAKRAVQLRKGFPSTLAPDEYPKHHKAATKDVISIAMREVLLDKEITWGKDLPSDAELIRANADKINKTIDKARYSATPDELSDDGLLDDDDESSVPIFGKSRPRTDRQSTRADIGL